MLKRDVRLDQLALFLGMVKKGLIKQKVTTKLGRVCNLKQQSALFAK